MADHKYTSQQLKDFQSLPLDRKIQLTKTRLIEWYQAHDNQCYVSFSGGKDSTVLSDITAQVCKVLGCKLTLWFSDTGLEYPEVKQHVKDFAEWLRKKYEIEVDLVVDFPKDKNGKRITFKQVIEEYGYPLVTKNVAQVIHRMQKYGAINKRTGQESSASRLLNDKVLMKNGKVSKFCCSKWKFLTEADFKISNECCDIMKKTPAKKFNKESGLRPILGTMASESARRKQIWIERGCNIYDAKEPSCRPISFWTEQDVLAYISTNAIPIPSVYGEVIFDTEKKKLVTTGLERSGCIFCGFGAHIEQRPNRFERLKETHPQLYDYCMRPADRGGLNLDHVLTFAGIPH